MSVNGYFTFAGTSSADYDVHIENVPAMNRPARKQTVIEVPGRSGDIVFPEDAWSNVQQGYDIFKGTGATAATKDARALISWLHGVKGYQRLTDTFDPEIYRLGYLDGDIQIENIRNNVWKARVMFSCRPERYLLSGETEITLTRQTAGQDYFGYITNPTVFHAKPLIVLTGSGSGYVQIYTAASAEDYVNISIRITGLDGTIVIDCETQDAYYNGTNMNDKITLTNGKFFELASRYNNVQVASSLNTDEIKIIPRWWTL